jgi:hypothetical protein
MAYCGGRYCERVVSFERLGTAAERGAYPENKAHIGEYKENSN